MWYLSGGYAQADFDWKIAGAEYDGGISSIPITFQVERS